MSKPNQPGGAPPLPLAKIALPSEPAAARGRGVTAPDPATPRPPGAAAGAPKTLVGVSLSPQSGAPQPEQAASNGPLSSTTIALVQASWAKVLPISDAAAALFYDRLFELDPSVRPLFKNDMASQKKKLMQTLGVAVDGLSNTTKLVPVLQALGARHAGYMVEDRHYDLVGQALLWTLREGLGDDFTPDVEKAWTDVYGVVAGVMTKAAADAAGTAGKAEAPAKAAAPAKAEAKPPKSPPPPRIPEEEGEVTMHFVPPSGRAAAPPEVPAPPARQAPQPAPAAPVALSIPLPAQDVNFNIRVQLDRPAAFGSAAPGAEPAAGRGGDGSGLAPGLLLAAVCVAASMGAAMLGAHPGAAPEYGVPLTILVLTLAAFGFGFLWGRGRGGPRG